MASNISFWVKSLRVIPQVSKDEWLTLDTISRWLVATRSAVFIMTAISSVLGGILAYYYTGAFDFVNFLLCLAGLVFAHAANNLINDLVDFNKGIDRDNYYRTLYGPQIIERGYTSVKTFYLYIAVTLFLALACGTALLFRGGTTVLYFMIAGIFFLVFYTWPLKYIGLGELTVVFVWGPLMIGGAFYVVSGGQWNWDVVFLSLVYAIGPTSVIFGKHIDKLDKDKEKRVHTLPVIIGERTARYTVLVVWLLQYIATGILVLENILGYAMLLVLLAIPSFIKTAGVFFSPKPADRPKKGAVTWPLYFASYAFVYNRRFSLLFLTGVILSLVQERVF